MTGYWIRNFFWVLMLLAFGYAVHLLSSILLPFVAGAGIAFFLDPLVDRLERIGIPRSLGSFLALAVLVLAGIVFILAVVPMLTDQARQLFDTLPHYIETIRHWSLKTIRNVNRQLSPADAQQLHQAINAKIGEIVGSVGDLLSRLLTGSVAIASLLSLAFVTPIVAFFLLRDWDVILATANSWLPQSHASTLRQQAREIEETLSGFLRGQASVCLVMGAIYAIGLTLLGLDFGAVVGLLIGLLIFIPFLGGLTGAIISVLMAFSQFGDVQHPAFVAGLFAVGQTIESNILTPKLVGDRVHLHPVWIIFALLASAALFGFVGVLLAVPIAAVVGVFVRHAIQQYLASPLYDPMNLRVDDEPL